MDHNASDEDSADIESLTRDAYAHFGLAYFLAECAYEGLVHVIATDGLHLTRGVFEERVAVAKRRTLGQLVASGRALIDGSHHELLDRVVARRNDLAHGFWFENAYKLTSIEGLRHLIEDLQRDQTIFEELSRLTDEIVEPRLQAAGITPEIFAAARERASKEAPEPVSDREPLKPGASLMIRSAWNAEKGALIFEDDSGQLWQPGDIGLTWVLAELNPSWSPAKCAEFLPASVVARPRGVKPWEYVLEFTSGLKLVASIERESGRPRVTLRLPRRGV